MSPPLAVSPPPQSSLQPVPQAHESRKRDLDDGSASVDSGTYSGYGELNGGAIHDKSKAKIDKHGFVSTLSKIQESSPYMGASLGSVSNGSASMTEESNHQVNSDNR